MSIDRRRFLTGTAVATAIAVVGFDPQHRRWITEAEAATSPSFANVPALDGRLVMDRGTIAANSHDEGNIVSNVPCAVLYPGSVRDIQTMIRYCGPYGIKVATNSGKNSVFGQTLASGGLIINGRSLNTIHSITRAGADVDAGVLWMDLIKAAYPLGLTPATVTGYTQLGIAGTLSIGGIASTTSNRLLPQVNQIQQLEVVTGTGDIVHCSPSKNSELFSAMCAGLGQCGVITRATVNMIPAHQFVRLYRGPYTDISALFADIRMLANRGERPGGFSWVGSVNAAGAILPMTLWAAVLYNQDAPPPPTAVLMRGCSVSAQIAPFVDMNYLDYVLLVDTLVDTFKATLGWDTLIKPWINMLLPDDGVEQFVGSVMPKLTLDDVSPTTFILVTPQLRSSFTRPLLRVPSPASGPWCWVFGILTNSWTPGPNPDFTKRMLARNYTLWKNASAIGGTRYLEDAVPFTQSDWQTHYGPVYPQFAAWKRRFDPYGILAPGSAIF